MLFDDQEWYVGKFTGFKNGKWHVMFADGDEDDISLPDPDCKVLPPVSVMLQAADEAAGDIKSAMKKLLQGGKVPAGLAQHADEIKQSIAATRKSIKDSLNKLGAGKAKKGEGSVAEVRDNLFSRVRSKIVDSDKVIDGKYFDALLAEAVAVGKELDGQVEQQPASTSEDAAESGSTSSPAAAAAAAADSGKKAKGEKKELVAKDSSATPGVPLTGKKSKGGKTKAAAAAAAAASEGGGASSASTPGNPKIRIKLVHTTPKTGSEDGDDVELDEIPYDDDDMDVDDASPKVGASGKPVNIGEKAKADWRAMPPWLHKNSHIEVHWEGDWWQCKAMKIDGRKVLCHYVGGDEEEWVNFESGRIRPPSDNWDSAIAATPGETIEVRRPAEKKSSRKWIMAKVLEADDDNKTVKVQYIDEKNRDLPNEWVSTDAKTCRPVSSGEAEVPKTAPDGGKLDIKKRMTKYPWPNGETLAGDVSHEIIGSSLMMIQFMGTFGKAVLQKLRPVVDVVPGGLGPTGAPRAEDIAEWTTKWSQVMPDTLLDDVRKDEPPGYLMGAVLSLINVLLRKDKKDPKELAISEMMVPDALTLPALAARVVEKDLRDRNRRVVKERLEESLLSEDAVQEFNISKSWAYGKGSDKKPPAYRFDELEGRKVSIEGTGPFAGTSLTGETAVSDGQVRISCCGVTMRKDDFEHFGAPPPGSKSAGSSIMVETSEDGEEGGEEAETPVELGKLMEAARLEGAEEAEAEVDWNLAMEQLLGGQLMACERKMAKALENTTWSSMSFEMRWSLICLLTEIALGSDVVRSILSNPVEDAKVKGTPGRPGNALLAPGTPGTPLTYGTAMGTPGAAMTPGAGGAEDKKDDKKELYRVECIGSDRQGRRYFTFPWSRGKMAVEVPASDLQPSPYAKQGANRQCPYDEAPSWEFYTDEHLDALEAHFKHTEDHGEARLIKKIKKIREEEKGVQQAKDGEEVKDAPASSAAVIAAPPAASSAPAVLSAPVAPAAPVAHASVDEAKDAEASPPAIPLGMPGNTPAVTPEGLVPEVAPLPTPLMGQPPVVVGLGGAAMGNNAADTAAQPLAYVDQMKIFPYKGEYVAKEDETPVAICERYGICVDLMCKMNEEMYKGLHARARFKNGTHLQFPTPTLTTLCRSVTRPPKKILTDVINIIVTELEVMPLSHRISSALKLLKQACEDVDTIDPRTVADALITLEHALVLPTTPNHKPIQSDRLFKLEWLDQRRDDWVHRLKKATTLPQVAVALEEFHVVALVGVRHVRNVCVTRWMYRSETTKSEQTFVESMAKEYFCHMPDKGEIVFYTKQGHLLHLETFPQRIGDCLPDMDVGTCIVEEAWNFKSTGNFHPHHTTLQLRRCPIADDLVGHRITVTSFPTSKDMVLPQVCKVAKYNEEVGRQHLLQWESGDPESWVCLDDAKWAITNPEEVGPTFFASIHCQQKLPGFILNLAGMRKIKAIKFNRGQRVRMWFWNGRGSVTTEGNFYTGTVINHKQAADPWNTVQVEWDATDGDDPDVSWACPWELRMWDGDDRPREPKPGTCMKDCVTTQAEAMRLPDGGKYVTEQEDLTPRQVAQATGVDLDLLVMINKGNYQGLTKLSKLLKNTKLRLPPRGVRYERKPVHGISQPMDQQQQETIAASNVCLSSCPSASFLEKKYHILIVLAD